MGRPALLLPDSTCLLSVLTPFAYGCVWVQSAARRAGGPGRGGCALPELAALPVPRVPCCEGLCVWSLGPGSRPVVRLTAALLFTWPQDS